MQHREWTRDVVHAQQRARPRGAAAVGAKAGAVGGVAAERARVVEQDLRPVASVRSPSSLRTTTRSVNSAEYSRRACPTRTGMRARHGSSAVCSVDQVTTAAS
jgi:hypothetical protein